MMIMKLRRIKKKFQVIEKFQVVPTHQSAKSSHTGIDIRHLPVEERLEKHCTHDKDIG